MRMKGKHNIITVVEVLGHIGNLHGIDMRHGHFDGNRQIDDGLALSCRFPDIKHSIADFQRILRLCTREALRRILEAIVRAGFFGKLLQELCAFDSDLFDFVFRFAEYLLTLGNRSGIIDMHDGILNALECLKGLFDDMLARLREYLNGDIIRNQVFLDKTAQERILCF